MFFGIILIAVALVGFLSVADDLRHRGEFFAVSGTLLSGIAFYVSGRFSRFATHLLLVWVPVGIAVGMLIGAIIDEEVLGVSIGLLFGLLLARLRRRRGASPAATVA